MDLLKRILLAKVYDVARVTPLERMTRLSLRLDNHVRIKREDTQHTFSFKLRGAYNKMARLEPEQRAGGVIACSAGNHAQGVAMAAQTLRCPALIVMPITTPEIKVAAVKALGADVVLHGDDYDAAQAETLRRRDAEGLTLIHPYDDLDVVAGQGTVGKEILEQHPGPIDAVFIAIGGGGLAAGVGHYLKTLRPDIKIFGVEPEDAASMKAALAVGAPRELDSVGLFADGVAVKKAGSIPFAICREVLDDVITVDTDAICAAIKDVFEDTRSILEPAGALGLAGLKAHVAATGATAQNLVAIACGANMNFDRLRHVSERAELGEEREGLFAATLPERPGAFRDFTAKLQGLNVTEFNYRYSDAEAAHVFVGVQLGHRGALPELLDRLRADDVEAIDLSDNEMAKLHLRHLVGGRAPQAKHEVLFRFKFPERPGALARFLDHLHAGWNISLFHYRNHGSAVGRVLCGMQVPPGEIDDVAAFLDTLGYPWTDETDNPGYRLFLR